MKKRLCSLALALCLALSLVPGAAAAGYNPFWDVPASHWAHSAVTYVYEKGLMQGTSSIYFSPSGTTTRAQVVTVLYRMAGQPAANRTNPFVDVPASAWFHDAVTWAWENDVTGGVSASRFAPNKAVTREQLATLIARYATGSGHHLPEVSDPADPFPDTDEIASWARVSVEIMRLTGLMAGYDDGTFRPQDTANRAQAATLFMRLDQALG